MILSRATEDRIVKTLSKLQFIRVIRVICIVPQVIKSHWDNPYQIWDVLSPKNMSVKKYRPVSAVGILKTLEAT